MRTNEKLMAMNVFGKNRIRSAGMENGWLRLLAFVALFSTLAQIIDGAIPQLRMALHGGALGGDFVKFKVLLIVVAFLVPFVKGYRLPPYSLLLAWLGFIATLIILSVAHMAVLDKPIIVSWIEYFDNYSLVILLPLLYSLNGVLDQRVFKSCMVGCLVIVVALGVAQFITSLPLVRVVSTDGSFLVNSWTMNGHIRSFSLFTSGLRFGYFCSLMLALSLAFVACYSGRARVAWGLVALIAIIGAVTTLTRNVYLLCFFVVVVTFFVSRSRNSSTDFLYYLPIICWIPFALVAIGGPVLVGFLATKANVLDAGSLSVRMDSWASFSYVWLQKDVFTIFFGAGISQMSRFSDPVSGPVVDNVILGVGLHLGMLGLLSFLILIASMWFAVCKSYISNKSPVKLAFVVLWSTFLGVGMLNASQIFYLACFFLFLLVRDAEEEVGVRP